MPEHLAVTFSAGQLAVLVIVLVALVWWGFMRMISSMDKQFEKLGNRLDKIPEVHPTRIEMDLAVKGAHLRIDDLHATVHGRRPEEGGGRT